MKMFILALVLILTLTLSVCSIAGAEGIPSTRSRCCNPWRRDTLTE